MWDAVLEILLKKVEEGVEVRLMFDAVGTTTLRSFYCKKLNRLGIKCVRFKRLLPVLKRAGLNRNHCKIIIIDGESGYITGTNFSDEYINAIEKYGYFKDSSILIKGEAVNTLTEMFLQAYNGQGDFNAAKPHIASKPLCDEASGTVKPLFSAPVALCASSAAQGVLLQMLNSAREYVHITTPYLIIDYQLKDALKKTATRGVDVRIITPSIPDKKLIHFLTRSYYEELINSGVKIHEYSLGFIHSKAILCDGKRAVVSTVNLDYCSLYRHFECGVILNETKSVQELQQDFESVFLVCNEISAQQCRYGILKRAIKNILQLAAPLL